MIGYVICDRGEGVPSYYHPAAGRRFGSPHGWLPTVGEALQFVREQDAKAFLEVFLPQLAPNLEIVKAINA